MSSKNALPTRPALPQAQGVERVVHKARDFRAAADWDIQQQVRMTPHQRREIARQLKVRVYGRTSKDVRAWPRTG